MTTNAQTMEKIISEGDAQILVQEAEKLGRQLAGQLKTSQLRNIYGAIRRAANLWELDQRKAYNEAILLQPKLAYFNQRTNNAMQPLKESLDQAILLLRQDAQPNEEHFQNFIDFSEAIVAYHRANRKAKD